MEIHEFLIIFGCFSLQIKERLERFTMFELLFDEPPSEPTRQQLPISFQTKRGLPDAFHSAHSLRWQSTAPGESPDGEVLPFAPWKTNRFNK